MTATELHTDITLPISDPERMSAGARAHRRAGFDTFKVKVGRDWRADLASLRAVAAAVPDARFRLDANAGFTARDALALLDAALSDGLTIECFEQPCAADDLAGMAEVAAAFADPGRRRRIVPRRRRPRTDRRRARRPGRQPEARASWAVRWRRWSSRSAPAPPGLRLMAGAMVETRVGLLAMAHVVAALGGVDWVDLDTAFLLADDPFDGGWMFDGPRLRLDRRARAGRQQRGSG